MFSLLTFAAVAVYGTSATQHFNLTLKVFLSKSTKTDDKKGHKVLKNTMATKNA